MLPVGLSCQVACVWEATARKPGNVHRWRDFEDLTYLDLLLSAAACASVFDHAAERAVGQTVLDAVEATRRVVRTNSNLGIVLLLAPLAAVPVDQPLRDGLQGVLDRLDVEDARAVYRAIRLARPSGLGRVEQQDVAEEPTVDLRAAMALAADRDLIARQYVNGFAQVFDEGLTELCHALDSGAALENAIIACQLQLLADHPDSLIVRKRGQAEAEEASRRARELFMSGWADGHGDWPALGRFDAWLCEHGHQRNPGTTADLVAACLFVALRQGQVRLDRAFVGVAL